MNRLNTVSSCNKLFRLTNKEVGCPWLRRLLVIDQTVAEPGHWHRHPGIEITCRIDGEGEYEFRGRPPVCLPAGHVVIIPGKVQHRLAREVDAPGRRIGMIISHTIPSFPSGSVFTAQSYRQFRDMMLEHACKPFRCSKALFEKFIRLADMTQQGADAPLSAQDMTRLRLLSTEIVCDAATPSDEDGEQRPLLMEKALDFLTEHLGEKILMDDLVAYMGYGQSQFFKLFKSSTGMTPNAWLSNERIKKAKKLLVTSRLSLHEIAGLCGFASDTYFFTAFRKNTGQTPLAFRNKGKGR